MSSTQNSALPGRARSLRKPTTVGEHHNKGGGGSESQLPLRGASSTGTGTVSERTLRRAAGVARSSRPLSGVFGGGGDGGGGRTTTTTTGTGAGQVSSASSSSSSTNPNSSRLGRAPSTRQVSVSSASAGNGDIPGTTRLTRAASTRQFPGASSAKSAASPEGLGIAPPRRTGTGTGTTTTIAAEQQPPTPLSRRQTVTESTSRRPTTSGGPIPPPKRTPSTTTTATHSRAKSSVTTLSSSKTLRPPSSTSQTSTSTTSTTTTDRSKPPITRAPPPPPPSPPPPPHKRAPSHPSLSTQPSTPGVGRTRSLKLPQGALAAKTKPEFNTHQQHFSPSKNPQLPKLSAREILAPPSPSKLPANLAISAETARLQTELLQLSLLHQSAEETKLQWEGSAYERLRGRFGVLAGLEKEVVKLEGRRGEDDRAKELLDWGGGKGLEGRVRVLDEVLGKVWGLTENGGRYSRVVARFGKWLGQAEEVMVAREKGEWGLVEGIGREWKEEIGSISRKVHAVSQELYGVLDGREAGEAGGLGRVLNGVKDLIGGMVEEIEIMEVVEREVREQEMEWVRRVNREGDEGVETRRRAGAVWRAF
ncbi:hypothetical protein QC762_709193 [Podospora pseudocomata]|uniref:Uncharacterized protein n=1 Tax=Podospora pseudocomata TaxID=2093779 RepID=A0ABR0G4L0_9PEZI|nr:hypothetical protein QC762_709193 [Podospora pseudocomata]